MCVCSQEKKNTHQRQMLKHNICSYMYTEVTKPSCSSNNYGSCPLGAEEDISPVNSQVLMHVWEHLIQIKLSLVQELKNTFKVRPL